MKFLIKKEQLQELLNYLSSKPWQEVNSLIVELSKLEKLEEKKDDKKIS